MIINLKDSNAAAHTVDRDIFYALIHLPARSKTNIQPLFLEVVSNREVSVLVCINFMPLETARPALTKRNLINDPNVTTKSFRIKTNLFLF